MTTAPQGPINPESARILDRDFGHHSWTLWGSYLPDRQWGAVREDDSADGDAWCSFPHDHARSRVYRWGEDGLLGICDEQCRLCFSLALWDGADPIFQERPLGPGKPEGTHGEDLKDYYFHLANTPTHSFMRGLYEYPQAEFPHQQLVDTGIFDANRDFDVVMEYAKPSATDLLMHIRLTNRGPDPAPPSPCCPPCECATPGVGANPTSSASRWVSRAMWWSLVF